MITLKVKSHEIIFSSKIGLSKTMDLLKNNIYTKLNSLDTTVQELERRVTETSDNFHEHTIAINEVLNDFYLSQRS